MGPRGGVGDDHLADVVVEAAVGGEEALPVLAERRAVRDHPGAALELLGDAALQRLLGDGVDEIGVHRRGGAQQAIHRVRLDVGRVEFLAGHIGDRADPGAVGEHAHSRLTRLDRAVGGAGRPAVAPHRSAGRKNQGRGLHPHHRQA